MSRYHKYLRRKLDMQDDLIRDRVLCGMDISIQLCWRHMIIEELNRVQNEEWCYD